MWKRAWWIVAFPGGCLFLLVPLRQTFSVIGWRDRLDPQARGALRSPWNSRTRASSSLARPASFGRWITERFRARGRAASACRTIVVLALDELATSLGPCALADDPACDRAHRRGFDPGSRRPSAGCLGRPPDIVVNNAGLYPRCGLLDLSAAEWDRIFGVNLRAPFLITPRDGQADDRCRNARGWSSNISSGASRQMRIGSVPYCTSKTAA